MMASSLAPVPTHCAVCNARATQLCAACRSVVYCSRDHQKEHWKHGHKKVCKCYEVTTNALLGRHLRATRDIKMGEKILEEAPLVIGPKMASTPLCLGCHKNLLPPQFPNENYYKCSKCTWPLCGRQCEEALPHATAECALMAGSNFQSKINYDNASRESGGKKESAYCVIMLLRCIQLKSENKEAFSHLYELEDHLQERLETPLYQVLRVNLITFIKTVLGLNEWTELEILRIAAILDTNTFEVRQPNRRRKVRALFPQAAMISHDCISNMRHSFDDNFNIIFIAKRNIAKGEILSISYTQPLRSTLQRRSHLRQTKCFDCSCARCADETELGSFAGSILCKKCKVGKVVSLSPLNYASNWKCQLCNFKLTAKEMLLLDDQLQNEVETLDKSTPFALEDFIQRHRDQLHETNTHVLQIKYALTQLYGNAPGFIMNELSDESLLRKVNLCEELLQLAELFDVGLSIFRGNLLIDLEDALVAQAIRTDQTDLRKTQLKKAAELLQEIADIMKHDPQMQVLLEERERILQQELKSIDISEECS